MKCPNSGVFVEYCAQLVTPPLFLSASVFVGISVSGVYWNLFCCFLFVSLSHLFPVSCNSFSSCCHPLSLCLSFRRPRAVDIAPYCMDMLSCCDTPTVEWLVNTNTHCIHIQWLVISRWVVLLLCIIVVLFCIVMNLMVVLIIVHGFMVWFKQHYVWSVYMYMHRESMCHLIVGIPAHKWFHAFIWSAISNCQIGWSW